MRVVLIGNLRSAHSTENDWAHGFETLGWEVAGVQEDDWINRKTDVPPPDADLLLWVRTWPAPELLCRTQLGPYRSAGVPIVGAHLDRWFGLSGREDRQALIYTDQYWRWLDWWFTSDPCQHHWDKLPFATVWMPPAVSDRHPLNSPPRPNRWPYDIVFVGNSDPGSYHPEHTHRFQMLHHLREVYRDRFGILPGPGKPRITGLTLTEIYRSVPVIIGDSCLVGLDAYWSDRVPETLGRGGYLLHPDTYWREEFEPGQDLDVWRLGDWDHMFETIDIALNNPAHRETVAARGQTRVLDHHLYRHRAETIQTTVLT